MSTHFAAKANAQKRARERKREGEGERKIEREREGKERRERRKGKEREWHRAKGAESHLVKLGVLVMHGFPRVARAVDESVAVDGQKRLRDQAKAHVVHQHHQGYADQTVLLAS